MKRIAVLSAPLLVLLLSNSASASYPSFRLNSAIDRHRGHSHGHAGSTHLTARALENSDGSTDVEITTGTLDSTAPAPGRFILVYIQGFDQEGDVVWRFVNVPTDPDGHISYHFQGLTRGQPITIYAVVRRPNRLLVDIVTVSTTVKLRPDPAVTSVAVPLQGFVGSPVVFSGTVTELNGDVGASADCFLKVDGTEVDRSHAIWVPAAESVTCVFAHEFSTIGQRSIQIGIDQIVPGDWSTANNAQTDTVSIVNPVVATAFAQVSGTHCDRNFIHSEGTSELVTPDGTEFEEDWNYTDDQQPLDLMGTVMVSSAPTALEFPLDLTLSQSTAGTTVHALELEDVPPDFFVEDEFVRAGGVAYFDPVANVNVFLDSFLSIPDDVGSSTITYITNGSHFTFFSSGFEHLVIRTPGQDPVEILNIHTDSQDATGPLVAEWGSTYEFSAALSDGTEGFASNPVVAIVASDASVQQPLTCVDEDIVVNGAHFTSHSCEEIDRQCTTYEGFFSE